MTLFAILVSRHHMHWARYSCGVGRMAPDTGIWGAGVNSIFVALKTIESSVGSRQRIGHGVQKLRMFPIGLSMALTAVGKRASVNIIFLMAAHTVLAHA